MDPQAQALVDKLKGANNVLVTVSANPSVDQLAAAIGLTLFLNKLKKHATAVFSGDVPSTIEFLKPEETLEKNTDSLRDFIIALDKAKADKLRYKVEENVVKIFITPYKTSITDADLDFSQGDFNVDVVLCIGVHDQADLDQAIIAHGRILHDAAVTSISTQQFADFASINWLNTSASSLSEMGVLIVDALGREHVDGQIATALLTGVVAETERFSNDKTSPETMRLSAELMAAGANQQLVASALQAPVVEAFTDVANPDEQLPAAAPVSQDGTLEIEHSGESDESDESDASDAFEPDDAPSDDETPPEDEPSAPEEPSDPEPPVTPPAEDKLATDEEPADDEPSDTPPTTESSQPASRMILQPPTTGGTLTANSVPEGYGSAPDPLTMLTGSSMSSGLTAPMPGTESANTSDVANDTLVLPEVAATSDEPQAAPEPEPVESLPPAPVVPEIDLKIDANGNIEAPSSETLTDVEPLATNADDAVDDARDAVQDAINNLPIGTLPPEPTAASGASGYLDVQNLDNQANVVPSQPPTVEPPVLLDETPSASQTMTDTLPLPSALTPPPANPTPATSPTSGPTAPPPVPPPLDPSAISQIMSQGTATPVDADTPKAA